MNDIESLKAEIEKAEIVLAESRDNFNKNPEEYSARLLLISMENHMGDLLKKLHLEESQQGGNSK